MMLTKEKRNLLTLENVVILLSFVLAVFVRCYRLSDIPYGMHIDEAGMGYDAWGIATVRADRWLNVKPLYLVNYGGGQSALYAYLCAVLMKLFGQGEITLFLMRLPGVLVNLAAYIAGICIIRYLMGKRWAAFGSFLLAILPYFIMQCRFGLDCNLLVNVLTIAIAFFFLAMEKQRLPYFLLAGLVWGGAYYTYALSYVANTVVLLLLSVYALWVNRKQLRNLLLMWVPVIVLGLPLAYMVLINKFDLEQFNGRYFTIPKLGFFRGNEIHIKNIFSNFVTVVKSILYKDWIPYNALPWYGTMYLISIPLVLIGLIALIRHSISVLRRREWNASVVFPVVFLIYFIMGLLLGGDGPNINKMNGLFFAEFVLLLWGIRVTYQIICKRRERAAKMTMVILASLYFVCFGFFAQYYFVEYREDIYPQYLFTSTYEDILAQLEEGGVSDRKIYVESEYIYYLLSAKISPYEYNIWVTGTEQYQNVVFHLPEEIEPDAVYIVRDTNAEYIGRLQNMYKEQCSDGMFVCYY